MPQSFGWTNLALPICIIVVLAVIVPRFTVSRETRSHGRVAIGVAVAAAIMFALSATVLGAVHFFAETGLFQATGSMPSAVRDLLGQSVFAVMIWLPVLVLVWLGAAQGVEKRKGDDAAKH